MTSRGPPPAERRVSVGFPADIEGIYAIEFEQAARPVTTRSPAPVGWTLLVPSAVAITRFVAQIAALKVVGSIQALG